MTRNEYRQVVLDLKDRLNTYVAWHLRDMEEAGDVTQDALLRLWLQREQVAAGSVRSWLFRTAYRLCVDRIRRRNGHRKMLSTMEMYSPLIDGTSPGEGLVASERTEAVSKALLLLPDRDRALLVMREWEEMSCERIATILACSTGTVKVALHRARGKLREKMAEVMRSR